MRVICLPNILDVFESNDQLSTLYVRLTSADVKLEKDRFCFLDYGRWSWARRRILVENKEYRLTRDGDADVLLLSSYIEGHCCLVDSDGIKLSYRPEIISLIVNVFFSKNKSDLVRESKVIGRIYKSKRESVFCLADLQTGKIKFLDNTRVGNPYLLEDCIFYFNNEDWKFYCVDYDLNALWSYKPEVNFSKSNIRGPVIYDGHVIISVGSSRSVKFPGDVYEGKRLADQNQSFDSNLYAFNISSGEQLWHITIPKTIDNMILLRDRLYISSTNDIHIIDTKTGKTENIINSGLSELVDQSIDPSSLHIQGDMLYFSHQVDACLLVYDLTSLKLIKRIDIPSPYTIKDFEFHHESSGKLYFNLGPRFPREYYHMSPILELDPKDLNAEIEIFRGPPVDVKLKSSEEDIDEKEIWITIHDVPLEEAMVYAEMHTQDQAYYHGTHGMFAELHKTEEFNGKVHFRYRGSDRPAEEVNKKLKILEKNFVTWGKTIAFASTNPANCATLEAKYLE
jgi:outer membrane protein assembly factor BamB